MPIQFYTPSSDGPVSGFIAGRKFKQDEAYRQAVQDLNERTALGKMSEFAKQQGKGQIRPGVNDQGRMTGLFEQDEERVQRDQPVLEKAFPELFKEVINKGRAAMPDPSVAAANNASTERAKLAAIEEDKKNGIPFVDPSSPGAPSDVPAPTPQIDYAKPVTDALNPQPLLKGKEEKPAFSDAVSGDSTKLQGVAAKNYLSGAELETDPSRKEYLGNVGGVDRYLEPVSKTGINKKDDTTVGLVDPYVEPKMLPAVPEKVQKFNPSEMLRAGMIERLSSASAKDSDPIIPYNSLTPAQRSTLGIPENAEGGQRASVLKEFIQLAGKSLEKDNKNISPMTLNAVKKIESGTPFSQAADELAKEQMFDLTDKQTSVLQAAESRRNSKAIAEGNLGFRKAEAETKKLQLSPKSEERILNLDTLKGNLENARNLVVSGKVRPRGELDIARRMGAYGGIPLEVLNASLSAAGREPINDDEAQFLKLTANVNLSKLVEVAGTTFTERFGSMINSLGADITDAKRFNQNVDQMVGEIERAKSNIVNVGQANKAGNIRGQQGMTSAAPKEQVSHAPKEEDRGPKPAKWDASMLRKEKALAQKAIDAAKKSKNPDMTISMIKKTFKDNTGVDFDGK